MTKDEKKKIRLLISQELDKQKPDKEKLNQLRDLLVDPEKLKRESEEERIISLRNTFRKKYGSELLFNIKTYIDMRNEGKTRAEISDYLGIGITILEKELRVARQRGILKPGDIIPKTLKNTKLTKDLYLREKERGLKEGEIQKKYSLGSNHFCDLKRLWGIPLKRYREEYPKSQLESLLLKGYNIHDIAIELKVTVRTVYNILRYHQITKKELIFYRNESKKHIGGIS